MGEVEVEIEGGEIVSVGGRPIRRVIVLGHGPQYTVLLAVADGKAYIVEAGTSSEGQYAVATAEFDGFELDESLEDVKSEFEWAQDFSSIADCLKRADGWIARGFGVKIVPEDERIRLYVTKRRICYKKRIEPVFGQLVF